MNNNENKIRVRTAAQICSKADELLLKTNELLRVGITDNETQRLIGKIEALQWVRYFEGEEL
jgi:hypothetical protein